MGHDIDLNIDDTNIWSGYISSNHGSKIWSVQEHFHGRDLATIIRELRRAIREMKELGVKAGVSRDIWESTDECFLWILEGFLADFCSLRDRWENRFTGDELLGAVGTSDQVWQVGGDLPELTFEDIDPESVFC